MVIDHMRKAKRFVTVSIEPVQDKIPQPRKEEVAKIPRAEIMRMVGELPSSKRVVFNLYCVEGYSHKDIAQMLDMEEELIADAEIPEVVLAEIPVDVPAHTDSVVIEESQPSVLMPVIRPSAAKRTEADDILLSDADSEGMIQVVQETAVVTEVFLAEVHEDTTRHDV